MKRVLPLWAQERGQRVAVRAVRLGAWCLAVDLLEASASLRARARSGSLAFSWQAYVANPKNGSRRRFAFVFREWHPTGSLPTSGSMSGLAKMLGLKMTSAEMATLRDSWHLPQTSEGNPLAVLEVRTCLCRHVQAMPRLSADLWSGNRDPAAAFPRPLHLGVVITGAGGCTVSTQQRGVGRVVRMVRDIERQARQGNTRFDFITAVAIGFGGTPPEDRGAPRVDDDGACSDYDAMIAAAASSLDRATATGFAAA